MNSLKILRQFLICGALLTGLASAQVVATVPYTVSVFATSIPGVDFAPDSIAVGGGHVFVGYGDGALPDGSDGKSSTVVEYKMNGDIVTTYTVPGHNDGLKFNPKTKQVWAMQNEDGNPQSRDHRPGDPDSDAVQLRFRSSARRWVRRHRVYWQRRIF